MDGPLRKCSGGAERGVGGRPDSGPLAASSASGATDFTRWAPVLSALSSADHRSSELLELEEHRAGGGNCLRSRGPGNDFIIGIPQPGARVVTQAGSN